MADAFEVLMADHREVEGLLDQVGGDGAPPEVINSLVRSLAVHDAIERIHLYPVVRDRIDGGHHLSERSIEEHGEQARTLTEIDRRSADDTYMPQLLATLRDQVLTHVHQEEGEVFPALRRVMAPQEVDELAATLEKEKRTAPTRPHPHTPRSGKSTKMVGAAAAPFDRLLDKVQGRS